MTSKRTLDETDEPDTKKSRVYREYAQQQRVLINNNEAGAIIGKGGSNVQRIREETGSEIQILKNESSTLKERVLVAKGSVEGNARALTMVSESLMADASSRHDTEQTSLTLKLLIHQHLSGAIIGKGGERIREIMAESGVRITISNDCLPQSTEKTASITGSLDAIAKSLFRVLTQLHDNPLRQGTRNQEYNPAASSHSSLYHHQPSSHYSPYGQMHSMSSMFAQQQAIPHGTGGGGGGGGAAYGPNTVEQITIPTSEAGSVIGKGGHRIREVKLQTGTTISIAPPEANAPDERAVSISGPPAGIQAAIQMIRQLVDTQGKAPLAPVGSMRFHNQQPIHSHSPIQQQSSYAQPTVAPTAQFPNYPRSGAYAYF